MRQTQQGRCGSLRASRACESSVRPRWLQLPSRLFLGDSAAVRLSLFLSGLCCCSASCRCRRRSGAQRSARRQRAASGTSDRANDRRQRCGGAGACAAALAELFSPLPHVCGRRACIRHESLRSGQSFYKNAALQLLRCLLSRKASISPQADGDRDRRHFSARFVLLPRDVFSPCCCPCGIQDPRARQRSGEGQSTHPCRGAREARKIASAARGAGLLCSLHSCTPLHVCAFLALLLSSSPLRLALHR